MVSNMGRIKSLDRWKISKRNSKHFFPSRIRVNGFDKDGYCIMVLTNYPIRKTIKVHRIVAQHFIPTNNDMLQINHINNIKSDNRVTNLEWVTCKENINHSYKTNGNNNNQFNKMVSMIGSKGNTLATFKSIKFASDSTNINRLSISLVCRNKQKAAGGYKWEFYNKESE